MVPAFDKVDATGKVPLDLIDLRTQLQQEHDAVKTAGTLWVSWFTFFVTVNYVALGWFTTTMVEGTFHDPIPLYVTAGNFIGQLGLGIAATLFCRTWAVGSGKNINRVSSRIKELTPSESHAVSLRRAHLAALFAWVYVLGALAMAALVIAWCFMAFHATTHNGVNPHIQKVPTSISR
jgi:hypothetical protein